MQEELKLEDIIEAVMFALGREITVKELSQVLKIDAIDIEKALEKLEEKYSAKNAIVFSKVNDVYALVTNSKYYKYVNMFVENSKKQNLSTACLETLTIIAYNPKITKAEIERIRGVNSDFAVGRLLECGLVKEVARLNVAGRPAIYSVTEEFLRNCNISSVSELPNYKEMRVNDEQVMAEDVEVIKDIKENSEE